MMKDVIIPEKSALADAVLMEIEVLCRRYPKLKDCAADLVVFFNYLRNCFKGGGTLMLCGNGGSASDADHITAELLKSFRKQRSLDLKAQMALGPELASHLEGALPAIALPQMSAFLSAYGNDRNADYGFAQLVWALGNRKSALWIISTSGESENVLHAARVARAKEMPVLGLSGQSGGRLRSLCDVCICVPETEVHRIQELHLPLYHCLCSMLENAFFSEAHPKY